MIFLKITVLGLLAVITLGPASFASPEITLSGDTTRPEMSTFAIGEKVELSFKISGLSPGDKTQQLLLHVVDEHHKTLQDKKITMHADSKGACEVKYQAPAERLGFYRVYAKLDNGIALPARGSRSAGYMTYCVVPDPLTRKEYPQERTHFGFQSTFDKTVNVAPYLGARWFNGGYYWSREEPEYSGQLAEKNKLERAKSKTGKLSNRIVQGYTLENGKKKPWRTFSFPGLAYTPEWAIKPGSKPYVSGILTAEGKKAWKAYCLEVGHALAEANPDQKIVPYQITWEPNYPWGFTGSDEDLLEFYRIAYPALHEADPRAQVGGVTFSGGLLDKSLKRHIELFKKGLGDYIDCVTIHAYNPLPELGIQRIRDLKDAIRDHTGKDMPIYITEQGWHTDDVMENEIIQAQTMIRSNLISLGEGLAANLTFYPQDFHSQPGYGYFYNLHHKVTFGSALLSPKPIVPAYAAMTYLLQGSVAVKSISWLGDTVTGYAYEREGNITLALWDFGDAPQKIQLPVGKDQVTVYDWMGNPSSVKSTDKSIDLTLSREPIYITGVADEIWGNASNDILKFKESRIKTYAGAVVSLKINCQPLGDFSATEILIEADERIGLPASKIKIQKTTTVDYELKIPDDLKRGVYQIKATLIEAGSAKTSSRASISVLPIVEIEAVRPLFFDNKTGISLNLRNIQKETVSGNLDVRLKGVPETLRKTGFRLEPGEEQIKNLFFDAADLESAKHYTAIVGVSSNSDSHIEQQYKINFTYAQHFAKQAIIDGKLSEWNDKPNEVILKKSRYVKRSAQHYDGQNDQWVTARHAWDKNGVYLAYSVHDDVFMQENTGFSTWDGDCIQVQFDLDYGKEQVITGNTLADTGNKSRHTEFSLALTKNGPEVFRTYSYKPDALPIKLLSSAEASLAVKQEGTITTYEAFIPWKTLGVNEASFTGDLIGLASAVNDRDFAKTPKKGQDSQADVSATSLFYEDFGSIKNPEKLGVLYLKK